MFHPICYLGTQIAAGDVRKRARSTGGFLSRHRSSGSIDGVECDPDLSGDTPTPPPPPPPPPQSFSNVLLAGDCTLPRRMSPRGTNISQYPPSRGGRRTDVTATSSFINNKDIHKRQLVSLNGRLPNMAANSSFRQDSSGSSSGVGGSGAGVNPKKLFHGIMKIKDGAKEVQNQPLNYPFRRAGSPPHSVPPPPPPPSHGTFHGGIGQSYTCQPQQQQVGTSSFKMSEDVAADKYPESNRRFESKPSLIV